MNIMNDIENIIKKGNILIEFYANWCGPCKSMMSELEKIKDKIKIIKIDVDKNRDIAKKYGVMTLPTIIYVKKDGIIKKNTGFLPADEILKFISE